MSTISMAAPEAPPDPSPPPAGVTAPPRTPHRRMRTADLANLGALSGLIAELPLPATVRALALAAFIAVGPGAAVLTWVDIPARARPAVILVLGMSITTIVTIGAMWSYRWDPAGILTVGIVAITASSGLWYRRNTWPRCRRPEIHWAREPLRSFLRHPSTLLSVLALILWAVSLPGLAGPDASLYGLLFSGTGPVLAVAMVITAAAFVVAIRSSYVPAAVLALGTAIIVERLTTTVATEMPLYDWTYKHVAVIDYIQVHNLIQPNGTDIYAQWPAFFVAMAWFCDVTGLNPLTLAHVWAPLIHVVIALVVFSAARVVKLSTRVALTAAFIVEIVNWVGQDYFSPQSWTLVLAYGLIVLLLTSRDCRAAGILAIVPFVAMVPTHQLTPFWVLLTTGLLVVTKRAKPWWTVLAMALVAGGYLLLNLQAVLPYGLLSGSSPVKNASSNFGDVVGSQAKWFTSAVCRSMSAGVVLSAMGAALILRRHRRAVLALCILAFSPLLLLLGQSYGGEAIFRVYLYGLVGIAILTAPILVWAIDRSRAGRFLAPAAATAWLAIVTLAGLNAYVALWPMIVQTREQFEVMEQVTASAEPGVRIMMMHPAGMPTRIGEPYARQTLRDPDFDNPLSFGLYGEKATFPSPNQLGALEWALDQRPYDTFVLFSEQSDKAVQYYGEYRADAAARFKEYLSTAAGWTLVYRNGDTVVFRHIGSGKEKWKWVPAS
ncbi:hypothetical protein FR943_13690 [Mycobacterium sp. TNTM28]|uniref:DUF2029 domain-containing protein n=1 Tax=[Mycobacterium] fortunisiensis TaxID=2600579 RepID=A0ABS6KMS7_9MYCO|nr:hypothetical protein [[Mycobacterium] fortunisiensis]MBU9764889.1 hypothetical protein [[Mycobacterium] fortunisiensis]